MSVIPVTHKGMINAVAGETITAAGPLTDVSIRVSVPDVTIRGLTVTGATKDRTRPAVIDASASTGLVVEDCIILGDGSQEQGIYMAGGTGLVVKRCTIGPIGIDRYFDHCLYLNGCKNFLVESCVLQAPAGAGVHLYSGGATGTVRDCEIKGSRWGVVAWGAGNDVMLERCLIHGSRKVENGRGYGIEAASGGIVRYKGCHIWDNEAANVYTQSSGQAIDLGSNVFAAPNTTPPPPPPDPVDPCAAVKEQLAVANKRADDAERKIAAARAALG